MNNKMTNDEKAQELYNRFEKNVNNLSIEELYIYNYLISARLLKILEDKIEKK